MNFQMYTIQLSKIEIELGQMFSALLVKSVCLYFHIVFPHKSIEVFCRVVFWCAGIAILGYNHFNLKKYEKKAHEFDFFYVWAIIAKTTFSEERLELRIRLHSLVHNFLFLTHSFLVQPFSKPWKQETVMFSDVFQV